MGCAESINEVALMTATDAAILGTAIGIFAGCMAWMGVLLKRAAVSMFMAALDGAAQDIWQA